MVDVMPISYLAIIDRVLVKERSIIKESSRYFKIYLPSEYNDIWIKLCEEKKRVDVIVFLPELIEHIDKILAVKRRITREGGRFKVYLPKKYNSIWERLHHTHRKVDLIIVFQ